MKMAIDVIRLLSSGELDIELKVLFVYRGQPASTGLFTAPSPHLRSPSSQQTHLSRLWATAYIPKSTRAT